MTEVRHATWLQYTLLLGAFVAGTLATQLVPAYQEHVGKITYPSRAAASRSSSESETSNGYSRTDHQGPKLSVVRTSS